VLLKKAPLATHITTQIVFDPKITRLGHSTDHGGLLIRCQDQPGVVSAISTFLADAGANIVTLAQHSTAEVGGASFQRTEFHLPGLPAARDELEQAFAADVAGRFGMEFSLTEAASPKRVAIMVSKTDHCVTWLAVEGPDAVLHQVSASRQRALSAGRVSTGSIGRSLQ